MAEEFPFQIIRRHKPIHQFFLDGESNVGKTSLIRTYASGRPNAVLDEDAKLRILTEIDRVDGMTCVVKLRDLVKQERRPARAIPSEFDGMFLIFSVDDRDSLYNLAERRTQRLSLVPEELKSIFPCVVLANKCDILHDSRKVTDDILKSWCTEQKLPYFEVRNHAMDVPTMKRAIVELVRRKMAYKSALNRIRALARQERTQLFPDSPERGCCSCLFR